MMPDFKEQRTFTFPLRMFVLLAVVIIFSVVIFLMNFIIIDHFDLMAWTFILNILEVGLLGFIAMCVLDCLRRGPNELS